MRKPSRYHIYLHRVSNLAEGTGPWLCVAPSDVHVLRGPDDGGNLWSSYVIMAVNEARSQSVQETRYS